MSIRSHLHRTIAMVVLFFLLQHSALARLQIEITGGKEGAMPIAIQPFQWSGTETAPEDLAQIVSTDLARTGQFSLLPNDVMQNIMATTADPKFAQWRNSGVNHVVLGSVDAVGSNYSIRFQLFDVHSEKQLTGYSWNSTAPQLRRMAHQISDIIYEQLTGVRGSFDTRIIYVTSVNKTDGREYRIELADSDGFNEQEIIRSKQPLMSPTWSPDGKKIAYVSFENGSSEIFTQVLATGKRTAISKFSGLNSGPSFSPDSRYLAVTLSKDGNPEIYLYDFTNSSFTRITRNYAIDTEATWAPDGSALIFTSDRSGNPQLYRIPITQGRASGPARRITFEGKYNSRANFSPDGKMITFIHQNQGGFKVAVMNLQQETMQLLTQSLLDESPGFSANGTMIIYATEKQGQGILSAVSVDGAVKQQLGLQKGDVREPAWSPYIYD